MRTKIRKLGTEVFHVVEHDGDDCPFCEAARSVTGSGIIYLENEAGLVQKVEVEMAADRRCVMYCLPTTRERAWAEIAAGASS